MLICTATHAKDIDEALRLYRWIQKLGQQKRHDCLLVVDPSVPFDKMTALKELAAAIFCTAELEVLQEEQRGWPDAANAMFAHASKAAGRYKSRFLWLEPDCVPLKANWLQRLSLLSKDNIFTGHIYDRDELQPHLPAKLMSGVGIYSTQGAASIKIVPGEAWDMTNTQLMTTQGVHTGLIQHFWGQSLLAPTFVLERTDKSPINALALAFIRKEAVLFHRCKDGSLIDLLDAKLFPASQQPERSAVDRESELVARTYTSNLPKILIKCAPGSRHEQLVRDMVVGHFRGRAEVVMLDTVRPEHPDDMRIIVKLAAALVWCDGDHLPVSYRGCMAFCIGFDPLRMSHLLKTLEERIKR